jgi:hypothetical protein
MISRICSMVNFGIEGFKLIKKILSHYIFFQEGGFSSFLNAFLLEFFREKKELKRKGPNAYFDGIFLEENALR